MTAVFNSTNKRIAASFPTALSKPGGEGRDAKRWADIRLMHMHAAEETASAAAAVPAASAAARSTADGTAGPDAAGTADGTYTTSPAAGTSRFEHAAGSPTGFSTGTRQRLHAQAFRITSPLLNNPWFIAAVVVLLFICNEYRKNNILFVLALLVFLAIRYRTQWKRVTALIAAFAMLTAVCLGGSDRLGDSNCLGAPTVRDTAREHESFDEGRALLSRID